MMDHAKACGHYMLQARLNKSAHFLKCQYIAISATIRPEITTSLVSNERSGSLLFSDVPGYEIWT